MPECLTEQSSCETLQRRRDVLGRKKEARQVADCAKWGACGVSRVEGGMAAAWGMAPSLSSPAHVHGRHGGGPPPLAGPARRSETRPDGVCTWRLERRTRRGSIAGRGRRRGLARPCPAPRGQHLILLSASRPLILGTARGLRRIDHELTKTCLHLP
jgi:hypothetical protein